MALPTLMIKGKLQAPDGDADVKAELNKWVPLDYIINWFQIAGQKTGIANRVLILKSETASGKSTALPPEIYKKLVKGKDNAGIICTQPRVATAIENVIEMMKHNSKWMTLGQTIGWSTKYNKFRPKEVGLLSATIGTLAQQLRSSTDEEIMKQYRFILIDETHERDQQTDMTISMLKSFLLRNQHRPDCPFVVLMSATFDPAPLLKYFGIDLRTNFIWCVGATAPIVEKWAETTLSNYPVAAAETVEKIVTGSGKDDDPRAGDILIFMPGKAEFIICAEALNKLNTRLAAAGHNVMSVLQIDGPAFQTQNHDFALTVRVPINEHIVIIGGKKYTPGRRVIISTNVAETGLTLENLKYVIDSGYNREIEFNPVYGIRSLLTKPAPVSRIRQRRGRAGRKFPGEFYALYPKYIYDKLPAQQFPQILTDDISPIILSIIAEQLKNATDDRGFSAENIDMIDVPTPDALSAGLEKLYTIGLITGATGIRLTELGKLAASLNLVTPESARMILGSYYWDCSTSDMITIAAWLALESRGFIDSEGERDTLDWATIYKEGLPGFMVTSYMLYKTRLLIGDEFIHGIILFNAISYAMDRPGAKNAIDGLQKWCKKTSISYRTCIEFIKLRDEIIEQALIAGLDVFHNNASSIALATADTIIDTVTKIKYCIYDGYRNNILSQNAAGEYATMLGVKVKTPKLFREDEASMAEKASFGFVNKVKPRVMIYKELSLKYNRKTQIYDIITDRISVLDGFISHDIDFAG